MTTYHRIILHKDFNQRQGNRNLNPEMESDFLEWSYLPKIKSEQNLVCQTLMALARRKVVADNNLGDGATF